ncbi:MAG: hypothetical protein ACE5FG_00250 [Myxococcota bacterium]
MSGARHRLAGASRALPWLVTALCFGYLYLRLDAAAVRSGAEGVPAYLATSFRKVSWGHWLALMIPYSGFYFLIDSLVTWRVIRWFNAPVRFRDILPIRGSAYILSIVNEQVSKGAIALYLNRRHGVPGWQVASSMLFIMFCEFYYLLTWATIGVLLHRERFPEVFHGIPWMALASAVLLCGVTLFFSREGSGGFRERPILHSFRRARAWQYLALILLRSPALLAAVWVYSLALELFGVQVGLGEMLGYLPVIFFGAATPGPMRSVAIVLWVVLFPEHEAELTIFGFVQHNFFIFFNAAIGLLFLRRATRDLFSDARSAPEADPTSTGAS